MNTPTHNDVSIPGNVQPGVQQILPFYHDCCYAQVLLIHLCYKRMSSNVQRYQTHFIFVGTKSSAHVSINCIRMCVKLFGTPQNIVFENDYQKYGEWNYLLGTFKDWQLMIIIYF